MDIQTDKNQVVIPERVVLFGSEGGFSRPVLKRLLAEGVSISAVVMPGFAEKANTHQEFPVAVEQPINRFGLAGLAASHEVPVYRVLNINDHRLVRRLCELTADILLVACFPFKLPRTLWQLERFACWNLHPSLLPKYRGPAPVFWQLCNRESRTGVTLHEISERLDAGSIVAQKSLPISISISASELEKRLAECGVGLFLEALAPEDYDETVIITSEDVFGPAARITTVMKDLYSYGVTDRTYTEEEFIEEYGPYIGADGYIIG